MKILELGKTGKGKVSLRQIQEEISELRLLYKKLVEKLVPLDEPT